MAKSKNKTPWPTHKVMQQIYKKNLWGTNGQLFYSGDGSHSPSIVKPYVKKLRDFLSSFNSKLSVCDLGCGDFNVGSKFVDLTSKFYAIDIVEELILLNRKKFKNKNLEFLWLDITKENLPKADCLILRQVLQHLSNQEIEKVVKKLHEYKYVFVTEHLPDEVFIPNLDKISGQGIRLKNKSGVDITKTPFNFKYRKATEILSCKDKKNNGVITTTLYEH